MAVQVSQNAIDTVTTMLAEAQGQLDGSRQSVIDYERQVADLTAILADLEVAQ